MKKSPTTWDESVVGGGEKTATENSERDEERKNGGTTRHDRYEFTLVRQKMFSGVQVNTYTGGFAMNNTSPTF